MRSFPLPESKRLECHQSFSPGRLTLQRLEGVRPSSADSEALLANRPVRRLASCHLLACPAPLGGQLATAQPGGRTSPGAPAPVCSPGKAFSPRRSPRCPERSGLCRHWILNRTPPCYFPFLCRDERQPKRGIA